MWQWAAAQPSNAPSAVRSSQKAVQQYRSAVALQNRQMYDLAVAEWKKFLSDFSVDPLAADASYYLGVCYFQAEDFVQAEAAFQQCLDQKSISREQKLGALLNLGLTQFNLGQSDDQALRRAAKTLRGLSKSFPESKQAVEADYYLAEAMYKLGEVAEAAKVYQATLDHSTGHPVREKVLYGLGVAYQESGFHEKSRAAFEQLVREFPRSALAGEARVRRADALFAVGEFSQAEREFAAAAATDGAAR